MKLNNNSPSWRLNRSTWLSVRQLKRIIAAAAMLIVSLQMTAQPRKNYLLKQGIAAGTMIAAGWLSATNEVATHDYRRFSARHPSANPQWANPRMSFKNKYAAWPQDKSPAYFGSKTILAWTTDRHHLYNTTRNFLVVGNIGISLSLYEKPNWKQIVVQAAASWACFAMGSGAAHAYYKPIN